MRMFERVLLSIDDEDAGPTVLLVAADALEDEDHAGLARILRCLARVGMWPRPKTIGSKTEHCWTRAPMGVPRKWRYEVRPGFFEQMERADAGVLTCLMPREIAFPSRYLAFISLLEAVNKLTDAATFEGMIEQGWEIE